MRSTRFRLVAFTLLAAGLGVALLALPREAAAQKPLPVDPTQPGGKEKDTDLLEKISFPENKQTNEQFRGLIDYASAPNPNYQNLFRLSQLILDAKSDYFFLYTDGAEKGRRVSVKEETNRLIGSLKKEGLDYYQLTYGPEADTQLKLAKENGYDRPRLADIAQRYYHTKAGAEAATLLAALYLEAGNYPEAAYGYRKLLARPDADKALEPGVLFRAAVALRRAGDGKQTDEVAAVWEKLEKKFPRDGLTVGRKAYTLEQLKAELDRPVPTVFGSVGSEFVAMKGGDNTRTAAADAGVPFLGAENTFPLMYNVGDGKSEIDAANTWLKSRIDQAYMTNSSNKTKSPLIPSFFPITAPNMIVFRGYDGVYAFYTKDFKDATGKQQFAGTLAWFTTAKWGATTIHASGGGGDGSGVLTEDNKKQEEWYGSWNNTLPSVMFENPLAGSLSHDGKRVYFVDDYNIPPPAVSFNPEMGWNPGMTTQAQGGKVEYNRLVAVDLESGMLSWSLGELPGGQRVDDDDRLTAASQLAEGAYFLGPPVTVNGKLYVLLERDGSVKLACLDPQKELPVAPRVGGKPGGRPRAASARQPELVWVQNLGRVNTPIKQDSLRRFQGAFLASADGVMVCPTNSGAVVAVDLNARSLLWAHTYATLDPGPNVGGGRPRPFPGNPGGQGAVKDQRWRASAPMIAGGRVLLSAHDSGTLQCLDLRTGKLLWQENRRTDDLYVGGVAGDKVLVVGKNSVRAIKLVGEKDEAVPGRERATPAWENERKIATPIGHGVVGKDGKFYLPVIGDTDKPDDRTPSVLVIDATTSLVSQTQYRRKDAGPQAGDARLALGNLVFHDGLMYSQSATEVAVFQLNEVKRREVQLALDKNPNDPVGLFSRGELALERGDLQAAIDDFKASEKNKPDEATTKKLKTKLYIAYTEVIRNDPDFAKAEKLLAEYKTLCEFPLPPKEDVGYARAREEQVRRLGLYYNLLADGRERQGRLVDAFDAYRAYAELGEQNKLLPVPEDPSTLALSGVWAAGRIDNMMRKAKDAAARKPLEDKVATEWEAVKKANDLDRLRNFVKVFGPYFEAGREAQYLLALRLTETNDDGNRREAQALLLSLVAQADDDRDPANAARATDALARVLTDRGLTDDALGLYRRIAERYPTTQVRDGKTGADLLSELIADKRYLPSLESDRPPSMGKYKVTAEQMNNNQWRQAMSSLTLTTGGSDLMSFFSRNRVTLEYDVYGNGNATLMVTDRVTNEPKVRSDAMPVMFQTYSPAAQSNPNASMNNQRLAQISGHLMLLHVNTMVYCYDLSTGKKEPLWKMPLLGPNWRQPDPNQGGINYTHDIEPNGDMCVTPQLYNNMTGQQTPEWAFRVGKSMVLQANYATVLTKEGMITKDPRTGTTLWQRAGVTQKSLIFGDARHVFLVEPTATGYASRVFRAVDGVQVAKVPDFGQLVMGSTRLHILGRNVLVFEAPAKDKPKVLRLYDCLEGKDVWSKEYAAEAVAFDTIDPELTGVVSADGKIDILATRTGKPIHQVSVEAKKVDEHVKDAKGKFNLARPLLLADADRFYCFLNRDPKANPNPGGQMQPEQMYSYPSYNRARVVNGVAYAFDRGSGKRQWYQETEFVNQRLIVERFDDLPCLLATNPASPTDPNAPGGGFRGQAVCHKVVAVDKTNGSVRESKELMQNGNGWMQGIFFDKATGGWEFGGSNTQQRVKVEPVKAEVKK